MTRRKVEWSPAAGVALAVVCGSWVALASGSGPPSLEATVTVIDAARSRQLIRQVRSRLKLAGPGSLPALMLRHRVASPRPERPEPPAPPQKGKPATAAPADTHPSPAAGPASPARPGVERRKTRARQRGRTRSTPPTAAEPTLETRFDLSRHLGKDAERLSRQALSGDGKATPTQGPRGATGGQAGHKRLHALPEARRGGGEGGGSGPRRGDRESRDGLGREPGPGQGSGPGGMGPHGGGASGRIRSGPRGK